MIRLLPLLLLILTALTRNAGALMLPLSTGRLVALSDRIVEGPVTSLSCRWTDDGTAIVTMATLEPKNAFLGGTEPITFFIEGGTVGDTAQWVSDMPVLKEGETVLVFLRKPSTEEKKRDKAGTESDVYTLTGAAQGVLHLQNGRGLKGGFSVMGDSGRVEANVQLDAYRERLRSLVEARRLMTEAL